MTMQRTATATTLRTSRTSLLATLGSLALAGCIALAAWSSLTGERAAAPASVGGVTASRSEGEAAPISGLAELKREHARAAAAAEAGVDDHIGGLGELYRDFARAADPPSATMGGVAERIWEESRGQTAAGR